MNMKDNNQHHKPPQASQASRLSQASKPSMNTTEEDSLETNGIYLGLDRFTDTKLILPVTKILSSSSSSSTQSTFLSKQKRLNIYNLEKTINQYRILSETPNNDNENDSNSDNDDDDDDDSNSDPYIPVTKFQCEDSHVLKTEQTRKNPYVVYQQQYDQSTSSTTTTTTAAAKETAKKVSSTLFGLNTDTSIQLNLYESATHVNYHGSNVFTYNKTLTFKEEDLNQNNGDNFTSLDGDWTCTNHTGCTKIDSTNTALVDIIDLTPYQQQQYRQQQQHQEAKESNNYNHHFEEYESSSLLLDEPGVIFHLLRSILICPNNNSHITSPWNAAYSPSSTTTTATTTTTTTTKKAFPHNGHGNHKNKETHNDTAQDQFQNDSESDNVNINATCPNEKIIGIILRDSYSSYDQSVLEEMIKFRVGDASPSFCLYAAVPLRFSSTSSSTSSSSSTSTSICNQLASTLFFNTNDDNGDYGDEENEEEVILLLYRLMRPRTQLTPQLPTHITTTTTATTTTIPPLQKAYSYLWETYIPKNATTKHLDTTGSVIPPFSYRQVSPPYHSIETIYPNVPISNLLSPSNLQLMIQESLSIPQWAAWPEKEHYRSVSKPNSHHHHHHHDHTNGLNMGEDIPIWTVFPLCHTFPAHDLSKRKFVKSTCSFVPHTTTLLKQTFGPLLRTALFSRLNPETTLGTHVGWADLANFVLRLHIPLLIPKGQYCGTWVDGCVEVQKVGKIICFDDSKPHRAFNYSKEERIVLIVDLLRHSSDCDSDDGDGDDDDDDDYEEEEDRKWIPIGTSDEAHSNELDEFINNHGFT